MSSSLSLCLSVSLPAQPLLSSLLEAHRTEEGSVLPCSPHEEDACPSDLHARLSLSEATTVAPSFVCFHGTRAPRLSLLATPFQCLCLHHSRLFASSNLGWHAPASAEHTNARTTRAPFSHAHLTASESQQPRHAVSPTLKTLHDTSAHECTSTHSTGAHSHKGTQKRHAQAHSKHTREHTQARTGTPKHTSAHNTQTHTPSTKCSDPPPTPPYPTGAA